MKSFSLSVRLLSTDTFSSSSISPSSSLSLTSQTESLSSTNPLPSSSPSPSPSSPSQDLSISLSSHVGYGVFSENEADDITILVDNYTAPALAKSLRDREETLHTCAELISNNDYETLREILTPFLRRNIIRRRRKRHDLDLYKPFESTILSFLQRHLQRMPRQVFRAAGKRASVVIPLCNANGVPSVLFERRSEAVRTHKLEVYSLSVSLFLALSHRHSFIISLSQVCFPGGMVDERDSSIVETSLREMEEELGVTASHTQVLGVLRCNWCEVANLTGVAVTPVVGFIGDIESLTLTPNAEVSLLISSDYHHS